MTNADLIEIPSEKAYDVFTRVGGLDPYIEIVRKAVEDFVPSVETEADRAEVKSTAFRIIRSATYLEKVGKAVAAEQKKIPALIDAARRHADTELRGLAERIRAPLTDYENAEKARKEKHVREIEALAAVGAAAGLGDAAESLRSHLEGVQAMNISEAATEEFHEEYVRAWNKTQDQLTAAIVAREKHDADQAELVRLRAEAEKRQAEEDERKRQDQAKEQQEAAERQQVERIRQAEHEAVMRERNERVRERIADEQRKADTRHRARVEREAFEALVSIIKREIAFDTANSVEDIKTTARIVVAAIIRGEVANVAISY